MGMVKDGYGPKDPTPIRGERRSGARKTYVEYGWDGSGKGGSKQLGVDGNTARAVSDAAIGAGRKVRELRASGQEHHSAQSEYNENMARLQQIHPGLHQSVLAINHLEGLISSGSTKPEIHDQLAQAKRNLNARLVEGSRRRGGR
jgi:hypothetical protein